MDPDFIICVENFPPWFIVNVTTNTFETPLVNAMYFASQEANFSYILKELTSTWPQTIMNEECDIILSATTDLANLRTIAKYTAAYFYADVMILSSQKMKKASVLSSLDFDRQMLLQIFIVIGILALLTYFAENIVSGKRKGYLFLWDITWSYVSNIFAEPHYVELSTLASKIMSSFWWFSLIIILSTIGGNMKADLASSKESAIDSIQDIIKRPNLKPMIVTGSAINFLIMNTGDVALTRLYDQCQRKRGFQLTIDNVIERLDEIVNGKSVVLLDNVNIADIFSYHCTDDRRGQFYLSREILFRYSYHVVTKSDISDNVFSIINNKISYVGSTQLFTPTARKMEHASAKCFEKQANANVYDVSFLIYFWFSGVAMATALLLSEIGYPRFLAFKQLFVI